MKEPITIARALADGATVLAEASDSPRLDAEILLADALKVARSYLIAHPEAVIKEATDAQFRTTLARRAGGEPVAYILGEKEFWSLSLKVGPDTLVPRPETELLVEQALDRIPTSGRYCVLDLGTGSGAIALAIAYERPECQVIGSDESDAALAYARENARRLRLENVQFVSGDWTAPVRDKRFDVIVSNPPYVADNDPALAMLAHEPQAALVSGSDGLDDIRRIAAETMQVVLPDGVLLMEHGADQRDAVAKILTAAGWLNVLGVTDLSGLPRIAVATRSAA